jgi:CRISPR-associated endoribonuclease Cas6
MRLLVRLRCAESGPYEMQYHYHLQGFIYHLLEGSKYHYIHDREGYKFFCFSNVFPARDLVKGDMRTLMISSPDGEFISHLHDGLQTRDSEVRVGSMSFEVEHVEKREVHLPQSSFSIITGTPIIIRIPRTNYEAFGVDPKGKYEYVYWRSVHPVDLFLLQVENNLKKKYAEFHGFGKAFAPEDAREARLQPHLIQNFKFKKQVSTRISMGGFDHVVIGSVWEFEFDSYANLDMIRFALDSGLGERNSLGFGFMNLNEYCGRNKRKLDT